MDQERNRADFVPDHGMAALPVHHLFLDIARRFPARTALLHAGGAVSYAELATASGSIAAHLAARAIGPGLRVGLCGEASPATMAAILGILRTGAAYIPFDPAYPAKALGFMREDSRPTAMLVSHRQGGIAALQGSSLVIEDLLDTPPDAAIPNAVVGPEALAYVMYTSGSTGHPKGVMVPHRAVTRLVRGADYASFGPDEIFLQQAPLAFDASTFEIWGALLNGGTLALPGGCRASLDDIADAIGRFGVTTLWLTAGLFHLMVDHRLDALRPLRQLLAGGDVLSPDHVRRFRREVPGCRLINGYGPTENTTFSCCYTVPADPGGESVPIGHAINGTELRILDEAMQPAEEGELYLGGAGLALGYLGRPELTAEKFVADPAAPDRRLYRSGDRVRRRPDGALDFLGRADRQVKINGKRVELDEIEATARRSLLVTDAACLAIDGSDGAKRLALFVTPAAGKGDAAALRQALAAELPEHMRPSRLEFLSALPLTPNGKLDRMALAAQVAQAAVPQAAVAGVPPQIQALWSRALGTDASGPDENFFDLGGTSLQLTRLHAELQAALGRRLPVTGLFSHPTLRSLARWLGGTPDEAREVSVLPTMAARRNAALARTKLARGSIVS